MGDSRNPHPGRDGSLPSLPPPIHPHQGTLLSQLCSCQHRVGGRHGDHHEADSNIKHRNAEATRSAKGELVFSWKSCKKRFLGRLTSRPYCTLEPPFPLSPSLFLGVSCDNNGSDVSGHQGDFDHCCCHHDCDCYDAYYHIVSPRGTYFVWRAHILSWPRITCSQMRMLIFLEQSREMP